MDAPSGTPPKRGPGFSTVDLLLWVLVLAGVFGVLAGFWFYRFQLPGLPAYAWPFVMDSPLAGALVALCAFLALKGVRNEWTNVLGFAAGVASLKVGVWALFALALFAGPFFATPELALTSSFLVATHIVQILEGLLLLGVQRRKYWMAPLAVSWFLFNDWLDYGPALLHPALPFLADPAVAANNLQLLSAIAILLSVTLTLVFDVAARKRGRALAARWPFMASLQARLEQ